VPQGFRPQAIPCAVSLIVARLYILKTATAEMTSAEGGGIEG
jgi:hypothetical protein